MLVYIKIVGEKHKLKHVVINAIAKQNQDTLVEKQRELEHDRNQEFSAV